MIDIISIHAPHTGRDVIAFLQIVRELAFQSTRPIRGATIRYRAKQVSPLVFQSTRPIRGATTHCRLCLNLWRFQSTRPIRGATAKMHNLCSAFLQ